MLDPINVIFGVSALTIAYGIVGKIKTEPKDSDEETLNNFFKSVKYCNREEEPEYATVKYIKDYPSYKIFGINIPVGCDVKPLISMRYALENLAENDIDILYDNQNYRIKMYKGKLKKGSSYVFEKIKVPDTNHLHVTVGMTLDGAMTINLSDTLPNILLAGSSGAGKSRLVKSIVCQLLENYTPEQLKLLYLDNKGGVESNAFKHTKHLQARSKRVEETIIELLEVKKEMFRRLELIESQDVTNLVDYNAKVPEDKKIPFWFVVIDELFSFGILPSSPPNKRDCTPEEVIFTQKTAYRTMAEIASMCRASGIHLMFCTQRPTDSVIPTNITCNCGIRIGLRTASEQESRNIIEESGLELIDDESVGQGIIKTGKTIKFQSFWLTDNTITKICKKHKKTENPIKQSNNVVQNKKADVDWFIPVSK